MQPTKFLNEGKRINDAELMFICKRGQPYYINFSDDIKDFNTVVTSVVGKGMSFLTTKTMQAYLSVATPNKEVQHVTN